MSRANPPDQSQPASCSLRHSLSFGFVTSGQCMALAPPGKRSLSTDWPCTMFAGLKQTTRHTLIHRYKQSGGASGISAACIKAQGNVRTVSTGFDAQLTECTQYECLYADRSIVADGTRGAGSGKQVGVQSRDMPAACTALLPEGCCAACSVA